MSKQRPSDHLTSGLFNVLTEVCATGTCCYWEQADSTGIVYVIAFEQNLPLSRFETHARLKAHILQASTFDQQPAEFENH